MSTSRSMRGAAWWLLAAAAPLAAVAGYAIAVRPRMLRSGATEAEVAAPYPGITVIPGGRRSPTMATTIGAPPSVVWRWLAQMGYGRAGWYSWDHLDNWGHSSEATIHPEWQDIALGDRLPSMPDDAAWWEVAVLEPGRFLGLRASVDLRGKPFDPNGPRPRAFTDSLWGFALEPLDDDRTRLVVSGYWAMEPGWAKALVNWLFLEPAHWIMQKRQFAKLRKLAEAEWREAQPANPA